MSNDFSQYDQQQQFDYQAAPPPRQSSGCGKGCLILLMILGILAALFIGGLFWVWNHISKNLTNDPKEINSRLMKIFPTAQLPDGYSGRFGIRFAIWIEMDMLVFSTEDADVEETGEITAGSSLLLFSFNVKGMKQEELEDAMQIGNNGGTVIEKREYKIKTGEYEFDGFLQKVRRRREGQEPRVYTQILVPLGNNTMLMMQSDTDKPDEPALKQFLLSIAKDCPVARKVEK